MENKKSIKKIALGIMTVFALIAMSFMFCACDSNVTQCTCDKTGEDEQTEQNIVYDQSYYTDFLFSVSNEQNKELEIAAARVDLKGNVVIPEKVKIGDIDYSVAVIGKELSGFMGCDYITSIVLPKTIKQIDEAYALGGVQLSNIVVADDNQNYASTSGCLYNKAKTVLIKVPEAINLQTLKIASTVTKIATSACGKCVNLVEIKLPSGVSEIEESAFYNCTRLKYINLPASLTTVGYEIFYNDLNIDSLTIDSANIYLQILNSDIFGFSNDPEYIFVKTSIDTGTKTGLLTSYSGPTNSMDGQYKVYTHI